MSWTQDEDTHAPRAGDARARQPGPETDEDALDIRAMLGMLWRRKAVIVGPAVLAAVLAMTWAYQQNTVFTATAEIMLDPRDRQVVQMDEVVGEMSTDEAAIQSEIQVLSSRGLAGRVVDRLNLTRRAEFNPDLRPDTGPGVLGLLRETVAWVPKQVKAAVAPTDTAPADPPSPEEAFGARKRKAVDILLDNLEVRVAGNSRVLELAISSTSAARAARLANAYADIYIDQQVRQKTTATDRATDWLEERVAELRERVRRSEEAVAAYRREAGLVKTGESTITSQQLSKLNSELVLAQTKRAEAEARLSQVERLIRQDGIREAAKVLESTLIDELRAQRAEIQRERAELATEFGAKHPKMVNIQAQIQDINEQIRAEVQKILQNLRNKVEVAATREATLREKVRELENQAGELNSKQVRLRQLEREAEANRALFERFLTRLKETSSQEGIQRPDADIISEAAPPEFPSYPNPKTTTLAATMLALMAGVGAAFLLEQLDNVYRSAEQTESQLGLANLALVPLLRRRRARTHPSRTVVDTPQSAYAEAIRTLLMGVRLADVDSPPKVIAVTSAVPREGKTSVSCSIARSAAHAGHRVLLIDADTRHPGVHKELELTNVEGLVERLSEGAAAGDRLRTDELSGAHVLTSGGRAPSPPDLLGSTRMQELVAEARAAYDLVVIDTPPVTAVSDPLIVGRLVDRCVYVVGWAVAKRPQVDDAVKRLRDARVPLAGSLLSMVDAKRHAQYGYRDSGYYYRGYGNYYTES